MTQPGPWTRHQRHMVHSDTLEGGSRRFATLDAGLTLVMILSAFVFVFGTIFAVAGDHTESFLIGGMGLVTMILCGMGRVLIHIAHTVDRIAESVAGPAATD